MSPVLFLVVVVAAAFIGWVLFIRPKRISFVRRHRLSLFEWYDLVQQKRLSLPCCVVDLDAFDENISLTLSRANGCPIRVATKSVRCIELLRRLTQRDGVVGLMTYHAHETLMLAHHGFTDLWLAYPTLDPSECEALCRAHLLGALVRVSIDCEDHLKALHTAASKLGISNKIRVAIDFDMAAPFFFGAQRSTVSSVARAKYLIDIAKTKYPLLHVDSALMYEAQIAGINDTSWLMRMLKKISRPMVESFRRSVREEIGDLCVVNGGGTGSVETSRHSCTEVTVGSAFYHPVHFDGYECLSGVPSAFFLVGIGRHRSGDCVVANGGGFIASGSARGQPKVYIPDGVEVTSTEGWGEVQTPLNHWNDGWPPLVVCRHYKAGEIITLFDKIHLMQNGKFVNSVPTYPREFPTTHEDQSKAH